jgi:hypothetical protein
MPLKGFVFLFALLRVAVAGGAFLRRQEYTGRLKPI